MLHEWKFQGKKELPKSSAFAVRKNMPSILDKIVAHKRSELEAVTTPLDELKAAIADAPEVRDFAAALAGDGVSLIAEVKKASPSKGVIRVDFNPVEIARAYSVGGASCISVLTDENFFQGKLDYLTAIRNEVDQPLLRKDFVLSEYQVFEARVAGADAVLLIAECLSPSELKELHDLICELGMTPLVEFYEYSNLEAVLACDPKLVGVNNRDLNTFEIDLNHSAKIREQIPADILFVSESGIFTNEDVVQLESWNVDAILVGESLMRQQDVATAVRKLLGR